MHNGGVGLTSVRLEQHNEYRRDTTDRETVLTNGQATCRCPDGDQVRRVQVQKTLCATLAIAAFVLPTIWLVDVYVDFLGPYHWLLIFLLASGAVVAIIMSAMLAGTMFDEDDDDECRNVF